MVSPINEREDDTKKTVPKPNIMSLGVNRGRNMVRE